MDCIVRTLSEWDIFTIADYWRPPPPCQRRARPDWLLYIQQAGTYNVVGDFATPQMTEIGTVRFDQTGIYHLVLRATDRNNWQAVNVWDIKLAPQP